MTKNNFKSITIAALLILTISIFVYSGVAYAAQQETTKESMWGKVINGHIVGEERTIKVKDAREKLEKMTDADFDKQGLPVNMLFVDPEDFTLVVGIKANALLPLNVYEERIKSVLGDVPMKINFIDTSFNACSSQLANCASIVGGAKSGTYNGVVGYGHTLTLGATDTSGKKGFIITGHAPVGTTGYDAYQTYTDSTVRKVGKVIKSSQPDPVDNKRKSDSAFVECDKNIFGQCIVGIDENQIYRGSNTVYTVTNKRSPVYQDDVRVMGVASGLKSGYIVGTNLSFQISQNGVNYWYKNQAVANYILQHLDSGAPVFTAPNASNQVTFLGIHSAFVCIGASGDTASQCITNGGSPVSMLSTWNSIKSDLSLQ